MLLQFTVHKVTLSKAARPAFDLYFRLMYIYIYIFFFFFFFFFFFWGGGLSVYLSINNT